MSLETPASENNPTIESDTINGADILMGEEPNSSHSMKLENIDNSGQLANPLTKFGDLTLTGLAVEVAFNDVHDGAEFNTNPLLASNRLLDRWLWHGFRKHSLLEERLR